MPDFSRFIVLPVAALLGIVPVASAQLPDLTPAQWRADLEVLATRLPAAHGDLFHLLPRDEFHRMVHSLGAAVDTASPEEILTGIARIVAAVGEGHTSARILMPAMNAYPMLVHVQDDGVRIRRIPVAQRALLGARILRVEGMAIDDVLTRLATVIPADNPMGVRAWQPYYLITHEVLVGLGLDDGRSGLSFEVERLDGVAQAVVLESRPQPEIEQMLFAETPTMISAGDDAPPLLRDALDAPYWFQWLPDERAMFVRIDRLISQPGLPFDAFVDSLFAEVDRLQPERFVLDVRSLSGGNHISRPLIHALVRRNHRLARDRIFVLIGRGTFSAGQNLVTLLEQHVAPTFVGEPTGGRPNGYGVLGRFTLPNSGLEIRHSRYFNQDSDPADYRHWQEPHIAAPPDVRAEMHGRDPALEAALQFDGELPWSDALAAVETAAGDDARDVIAVARERFDALRAGGWVVENRINQLGYARMRAGNAEEALALFRLNVELFPDAWNAWDSLGEALAGAGRHTEARDAYARSLALNGYNDNARRGLALLRLAGHS